MKNLFIITGEEKRRILGLHENATKRQYLKETYNPATHVAVAGENDGIMAIFNKQTKKALSVSNNRNEDEKIRLDPKSPNNRAESENYFKDPIIRCQYDKMNAIKKMISNDEVEKCFSSNNVKTRVVPKTTDQLSKGQGYLTFGDKKNELINTIQDMLIFVGEKITKTGIYDRATYDAVKKFQTENKSITNQALKPDGILGKNTYLTLKRKYDYLKSIEFKAPKITDMDTGDDVVVPDNNSVTNTSQSTPQTPVQSTP
jgi:peptidoglycan hydrolase-like protein with peptidoglycan-binding domain